MNNHEKITELAEKAALEHLKKNNCPECCGSSYNSFLSGVAWKACEHEGWPVQKGGVIPDCSICGIPFDVFYAQERPLGSLFSHELQNKVPQWVKDFVDEEFPEEHYGGIEGYFEAWPLRSIFEQMVTLALVKVGGETSPAVRSLKTLVDRFLAWPLPKSVNADLCATDNAYPHQRSGTNLLNATEAEEMFKYVLECEATEADIDSGPVEDFPWQTTQTSHVPTAQCDSEAAGSGNQHSPKGAEDVGNKPASGSSPSPAAEGISKDCAHDTPGAIRKGPEGTKCLTCGTRWPDERVQTDSVFELKNQLQTALSSRDLWKAELERERQKFQNETLLTGSLYREIEALKATQLECVGALRSIAQDSIACEEPPYGEGQTQQYYFTEWAMKKVRAALSGYVQSKEKP